MAEAVGGDEMESVRKYFNTAGFERWNKIYGETEVRWRRFARCSGLLLTPVHLQTFTHPAIWLTDPCSDLLAGCQQGAA